MPSERTGPHPCEHDERQYHRRESEPPRPGTEGMPFTTVRSATRLNANVAKPGNRAPSSKVVWKNATPWHRPVVHAEQADHIGAEHLDFGVAADEAVCRLTHLITPKQRHERHARRGRSAGGGRKSPPVRRTYEPAKGSPLISRYSLSLAFDWLAVSALARSARLGPLCGSQRVQNSRNKPHGGPGRTTAAGKLEKTPAAPSSPGGQQPTHRKPHERPPMTGAEIPVQPYERERHPERRHVLEMRQERGGRKTGIRPAERPSAQPPHQRGMLPCFLGGFRSRLVSSASRAAINLARVCRGRMTSSTNPRCAAT